jgi:hypothetical protein
MKRAMRRAVRLAVGLASGGLVAACSLLTELDGLSSGDPPRTDGAIDAGVTDAPVDATDASVGVDGAATQCATTTPFRAPTLAIDVNSGASERAATLTADELVVCVDSPRPNGAGGDDIWCGTRPSRTSAFVMSNAGSLNSAGTELSPMLAPDGLAIYFASDRGSSLDLYSASRTTRSAPFGPATLVPVVSSAADEPDNYVVGGAIYFDRDVAGSFDLFVSTSGAPPVALQNLNTAAPEFMPVVSADELTIYFNRGGDVGGDILVARRTKTTEPFGPPTLVTELNTPSGEWPHWLSPDRCRLYFGSNRPGGAGAGSSIWVAERSP